VNEQPREPILGTLSEAEKDALILRLWDDLCEERARSQGLAHELHAAGREMAGANALPLLAQLKQHGIGKRRSRASSDIRPKLGRGFRFLSSKAVLGALAFVALAFVADYAIGGYQRYTLEHSRVARRQLEQTANAGLYLELTNITYEPDGKSYRLTMVLRNLDPQHPIYVMRGPLRVFEQSGLAWREVPAHAPNGEAPTVMKITDRQSFETVFEPNLKEWTALIPGYMHIRFESSSLVSRRAEPDDDIVERTDRYYVYLKPYGADDEAIRKRMKYAGPPPIYIPMPPH
jgi:hypothetical protein